MTNKATNAFKKQEKERLKKARKDAKTTKKNLKGKNTEEAIDELMKEYDNWK